MSDELKPCPFCGSLAIYVEPEERGSGGQWIAPIHVGCGDCDAVISSPDNETSAEAIAAWNERPDPVAVPGKPLDVECVAQFLHDEGGFDEAYNGTWPAHKNDTGQRDGGFVKLVPVDVQAKFRDVATRLITMLPAEQAIRNAAIDECAAAAAEWFPANTISRYPSHGVVAAIRALKDRP